MPNLTDVKVIRDLCARYDFALSKGFGQNFIVNPGICPRMVEAAGIDESFGVLEIGPGIGVLTKELAARAAKVVAVEVDERLPPLLAETLADCPNVKIVMGDVLKVDLTKLIAEEFAGLKVAVCANLPYYITSPIVMRLLEERLPVELPTQDDFALYVIVPYRNGFAPIGLCGKFLSPKTIASADGETVRLKEGGTFAFVKDGRLVLEEREG